MAEGYKVRLAVFEGPLDLLLYLIRRDELDIHDIRIEEITRQYMEYLGLMRMLDLDIAGEFLVMAATLMYIKSRMLLPAEEQPLEAEEEGDDPRLDLIRQLLEYRRFKEAAERLGECQIERAQMFPRGQAEPALDEPDEPGRELAEVSLFDLLSAFREVLNRVSEHDLTREIIEEEYSVSDRIAEILERIRRERTLPFRALFRAGTGRAEVIATFLALLELIRLRQLRVRQARGFGEIMIESRILD